MSPNLRVTCRNMWYNCRLSRRSRSALNLQQRKYRPLWPQPKQILSAFCVFFYFPFGFTSSQATIPSCQETAAAFRGFLLTPDVCVVSKNVYFTNCVLWVLPPPTYRRLCGRGLTGACSLRPQRSCCACTNPTLCNFVEVAARTL